MSLACTEHTLSLILWLILLLLLTGYQGGAPPVYQTTPIIAAPTTYVYVRGNCPACHIGNLQDEFTPLGICLAICFFPLGLLCCLLLTEKRCNHCGMTYA